MKLLVDGIVFENDRQRGIQRYVREVVTRINQWADVGIMFREPPMTEPPVTRRRHWVRPYKPTSAWNVPAAIARNLQWRSLNRYDLFFSSFFSRSPNRTREVVTIHDMIPELYPHLCGTWITDNIRVKDECMSAATRIIAISQATADDVVKVYPQHKSKIRVVLNGADHMRVGDQPAATNSVPSTQLMYVGDRHQYKGFAMVLRAMREPAWPVAITLKVVGPPALPAEVALLAEMSLSDRVQMVGRLSDEELQAAYAQSIGMIFPSLCEGFGFPLLEAQSLGVPVACSDIAVFREVGGAEAAIFFDPTSAASIAAAVDRLRDTALRKTLTERGHANARRFTWDKCAAETFAVFNEAIA